MFLKTSEVICFPQFFSEATLWESKPVPRQQASQNWVALKESSPRQGWAKCPAPAKVVNFLPWEGYRYCHGKMPVAQHSMNTGRSHMESGWWGPKPHCPRVSAEAGARGAMNLAPRRGHLQPRFLLLEMSGKSPQKTPLHSWNYSGSLQHQHESHWSLQTPPVPT